MLRSNQRFSVLFVVFAMVSLLALSYTPSASTQGKKGSNAKPGSANTQANDPGKSVKRTLKKMQNATGDPDATTSSILIKEEEETGDADDPDLPPWMAGKIDKEQYLRLRGDYIDMLRGRPLDTQEDLRARAVKQMEKQEAQGRQKSRSGFQSSFSSYTFFHHFSHPKITSEQIVAKPG